MDIKAITKAFNNEFGTSKTEGAIKATLGRNKILSGRNGRFSKGNKPWNSGTKGKGLTGPNSGSFKKGNLPANVKPIGHERIDNKDGYVWIKVPEANPYTGAPARYKQKHVHLYEQKNGPVPDGMVVIFKDGDRLNFDPENLATITRSELVRLNQFGYGRLPEELKPSALAMTQLKVKAFEMAKAAK
ncbi:MAG: HNH endonuclease [Proteobacteria bacterium]|nr:HNH endonuclease [Pseudomonadota bacterium]